MAEIDSGRMELAPSRQMAAMMITLSVDVEAFGCDWGVVLLRQAIARCNACPASSTCQAWLENARRDPVGFRDFCPNAGLFDRHRPEAPARRPR